MPDVGLTLTFSLLILRVQVCSLQGLEASGHWKSILPLSHLVDQGPDSGSSLLMKFFQSKKLFYFFSSLESKRDMLNFKIPFGFFQSLNY